MLVDAAANILQKAGEQAPSELKPTVEFVDELYFQPAPEAHPEDDPVDRYAVELNNYVGVSALARPFGRQQLTVGQEYHRLRYPEYYHEPDAYMEFNRTIMNVWLFDLVRTANNEAELTEAWKAFTACQAEENRLEFSQFQDLKQKCDETLPDERSQELFIASLIYADMGKSPYVLKFMEEHTGKKFADHDSLIIDVLNDPARGENGERIAIMACIPSFERFTPEEQQIIISLFESGFHLPQFQQAENLPIHLEGFQQLPKQVQNFGMLNGLFDIGGAQGDRIQNGTPTITAKSYRTFTKAWDAIHKRPDNPEATPQEIAIYCYDEYLRSRAEEFGFSIDDPEGRAFTRIACMMRSLSLEEIARIPEIFRDHLGETTRKLLLDFLNATGYEDTGALWLQYNPAILMTPFREMLKSGRSFEEALSTVLTLIPRIITAVRKIMDTTKQPYTTINVAEIVRAAEGKDNWRKLLSGRIVVEPTEINEAKVHIEEMPKLFVGSGSIAVREASQAAIMAPAGHTLYAGAGGGGDAYFGLFTEEITGATDMSYVSTRGTINEISGAEQLDENVFLATPDTNLHGARGLEATLARRGRRVYIVRDPGTGTITKELRTVTDHAESVAGPITSVLIGDSGGDIMLPANQSRLIRDHVTLDSIRSVEQRLRTKNQTQGLGGITCRTIVYLPGADKTPAELTASARASKGTAFDLTPFAPTFRSILESDGLPSAEPDRFSGMIGTAAFAFSERAIEKGNYAVQPLPVPLQEAMRRRRPWIPFTTPSPAMRYALVFDNDNLRQHVGLASNNAASSPTSP